MRPQGEAARLYEALSRVARAAYADERLLSCPLLAKGPDQGDILRLFLLKKTPRPASPARLFVLAARYLAANVLHFFFLLLSAIFARLLGWRSPLNGREADGPATPRDILIIDSFAVLPRIAAEGRWRDLYLPGLEAAAREAGMRPVTLYRLYGSRNPLLLWRALRALAQGDGGLLEAHLLLFGDWLRLVRHMALYPLALLRLWRSLEGFVPESPEARIRAALIDGAGQCVLTGEARRLAGLRLGRLLAEGPGKARVISWHENQTVNKSFYRGLRQAAAFGGKKVSCTGAQLFLWPPSLLNNQADDGDAALGLAPDRVLVNGPFFLPDGSAQDYAVGPSLRYGHLFAKDAGEKSAGAEDARRGPEDGKNTTDGGRDSGEAEQKEAEGAPHGAEVLALLSYHPEETRRVLRAARRLADAGRPLRYRFHPAVKPEDYAALLPQGALFSKGPLDEALRRCRAVMGAGSGSLAEAVAMGLPALAVEDKRPELGLNYLPDFGKGLLWETVRADEDPIPALMRLQQELARADRADAVRAFRDLLFREPTPERIRDMIDWEASFP